MSFSARAPSARVGELVTAALADAGLPVGAFAVVHGVDAGRAALQDPRIQAGAFTGSVAGGRTLFDLAAARPVPIPFYGELGSINPVVVMPEAAVNGAEELAAGLVASFTQGTGQFCTKPGLVLVPAGSPLVQASAQRVSTVAPGPMLGDRLRTAYRDGRDRMAVAPGIRVLAFPDGDEDAPGAWARPALFSTDVATLLAAPNLLLAENFGPSTVLIEWSDPADVLAAVDILEGSLTATLHAHPADDPELIARLATALTRRCGRLIWGGWPTGVAVSWAMHHGGPYPATTAAAYTSVGAAAVSRFVRPVCYQAVPEQFLPPELCENNPLGIVRRVDGRLVPAARS
jgi:NADP-dependent aldehyde dehydrogenase